MTKKPEEIRITDQTVREMADLARIEINDEDIPVLKEQFARIVELFETISEIETSDSDDIVTTVPFGLRLRKDMILRSFTANQALRASPRRDGNFLSVPRIIDDGKES